jgi:hypothetical protein
MRKLDKILFRVFAYVIIALALYSQCSQITG